MKKLLIVAGLLALAVQARAHVIAKLDNSLSLDPVLARDFTDGIWMAGNKFPGLNLEDTGRNDAVIASLNPVYLHGINGGNQSAGLVIDIPLGNAALLGLNGILHGITSSAPNLSLPPWLQQVSNYTSIEVGGSYNFMRQFGYLKPWLATVGAQVKIPLGPGSTL